MPARSGRGGSWLRLVVVSLVGFAACGPAEPEVAGQAAGPPPPNPPSVSVGARPEIHEGLQAAMNQPRHPGDGGGRAWLEQQEGDPAYATAGQPGRFRLVYEVGPLGIATEGAIYFQVSPFWDWSTPQVEIPEYPGYTTVTPSAADIQLEPFTADQQLLVMRVTGRPLVEGERITLVYGAGPAGAQADRMAERNSRFWFGVDGDGDGVRFFLPDSPGIDVKPGPPVQLVATVPSVARPGETVRATVALLDATGSTGTDFAGTVRFEDASGLVEVPQDVAIAPGDGGRKTVELVAREPGLVRLKVVAEGGLSATSNPMAILAEGPRIFWGDLHGHTAISDGTGTVEDYMIYARDVAGLDVIALTDHDHWGILPLALHPELWAEIRRETKRFHEPGRFVTLLGYEWTSWLQGHRHVLYFADEGEVFDSVDPKYETPNQLWDALRGKPALTFAHHSAGGPIATNWEIPPDPELEPLTEITSVHGMSEAYDAPVPIYSPVQGNFVRDVLDKGVRFGFVGSGDTHDGHPGMAHLAAPGGGLAAILSDDLTRESVLRAFRARRVYATSGPRIILRVALGAYPMGSVIPRPESGAYSGDLFVQVIAQSPLERVDLIRSGEIVAQIGVEDRTEITLQHEVENFASGEYLYIRAVQKNQGTAWSSPIYAD